MVQPLTTMESVIAMAVAFANTLTRISGHPMTIAVLIPMSGPRSFGEEAILACDVAMKTVNNDETLTKIREEHVVFNYITIDTMCDTTTGLFNLIELIVSRRDDDERAIHGIIGKYTRYAIFIILSHIWEVSVD